MGRKVVTANGKSISPTAVQDGLYHRTTTTLCWIQKWCRYPARFKGVGRLVHILLRSFAQGLGECKNLSVRFSATTRALLLGRFKGLGRLVQRLLSWVQGSGFSLIFRALLCCP